MKFIPFLLIVIVIHVVDILDPKEQLEKYKTLGFIGKLFPGMLTNFVRVVKNDKKKWVVYLVGIKCHKLLFYIVIFFFVWEMDFIRPFS